MNYSHELFSRQAKLAECAVKVLQLEIKVVSKKLQLITIIILGMSMGTNAQTLTSENLSSSSCFLCSYGFPKVWGFNAFGQLGEVTNVDGTIPVQILLVDCPTVGIAEVNNRIPDLKVYPKPATNSFIIESTGNNPKARVDIYNATGHPPLIPKSETPSLKSIFLRFRTVFISSDFLMVKIKTKQSL